MKPEQMICTVLAILVIFVLTAGCANENFSKSDIVVVKLTSDGTQEWSKSIDHGRTDFLCERCEVIPLSDGSLILADQKSGLYRLSGTGALLWSKDLKPFECGPSQLVSDGNDGILTGYGNKFCKFDSNGEMQFNRTSQMIGFGLTVSSTSDGGFVLAGRRLDSIPYPSVVHFDENGNVSWHCTEREENGKCKEIPGKAAVEQVWQEIVAKIDQNGNLLWQKSYGEDRRIGSVTSIIESGSNREYLVLGKTSGSFAIIRLTANGTIVNTTAIDLVPETNMSDLKQAGLKFSTWLPENFGPVRFFISIDGALIGKQVLQNASALVTETRDGGLFTVIEGKNFALNQSVSSKSETATSRFVRYLNADGSIGWEREIPRNNEIKRIVQMADGGYVLVGEKTGNFYVNRLLDTLGFRNAPLL